MTHYNISYKELEPIEAHNKAIQDIKDYLGEPRFEELTKLFKAEQDMTLKEMEFLCSFAGVQGYPVKAWYNYCFGL